MTGGSRRGAGRRGEEEEEEEGEDESRLGLGAGGGSNRLMYGCRLHPLAEVNIINLLLRPLLLRLLLR